jgi:hypothetical protein
MCNSDYETVLDDYVAISFTIDPEVREVVFHHPECLSAWNFLFKVSGSPDGRLSDGTPLTDLRAATMKAVTYLPPGETTRIDLEAAEGIIFGVSLEGRAAILYPIEGPPAIKPQSPSGEFMRSERLLRSGAA